MPTPSVERKLAAIFAADIAGYSRLNVDTEEGAVIDSRPQRFYLSPDALL